MDILERFKEKAKTLKKTVVLPESHDERIVEAANILVQEGICKVILLGQPSKKPLPNIEIIIPQDSSYIENFANIYYERRKHKGITKETAFETVKKPLFFAACMVKEGMADLSVGGSASPTADVLRAGIHVLGTAEGTKTVSSIFLMVLKDGRAITFGDCAVVPNPDPSELASIAIQSARTHKRLTNEEPLVAMLSFSTKGSAEHDDVKKVIQATEIAKNLAPDIKIDGELQFDAAFVPSVGQKKAPGSNVAGKANVFIFPDLDAGNIGYKIAQRIGEAKAIGPIVQGFPKPFLDLSRGCSVEDIVNTTAIGCVIA